MALDFSRAFYMPPPPPGSAEVRPAYPGLFDIVFVVGQGKAKTRLYGVRAILGVRSRVFQELLYGISAGFGSPQVPVAEILARAVPSLHGGGGASGAIGSSKSKNPNLLQVPEIEGPRFGKLLIGAPT